MRIRRLVAIPAILVFAAACASLKPNDQGPSFYGMVYDRDNQPVQNALVLVDGKGIAGTDVNGRFALAGLPFGPHRLEFRKEGYESLAASADYFSQAQVLYVKMVSAEQLLAQTETAMAARRWAEAEDLVNRAERARPEAPATLYLKAVIRFRRGDAQGAQVLLEGLLAREYREPAIYLLLADIFQYRMSDIKGAAEPLRAYLVLRYDPEVEKRLAELEEKHQ
jgi:hypothetical protein